MARHAPLRLALAVISVGATGTTTWAAHASDPFGFCPGIEKSAIGGGGAQSVVDEALLQDLLRWIGAQSDYDISSASQDPPEVRLCDTGDVLNYEGREVVVDQSLEAAYDLESRIIYLVRPWHATDVKNRSTLLHELVHDLQFAQKRWHCGAEVEWEAYKLQDDWLRENGLESGFNWVKVETLSECPRDIHP